MLDHYITIKKVNGVPKFQFIDIENFKMDMLQYADNGRVYTLSIKQYKAKRSINQNDFYYGVFLKSLSDQLTSEGSYTWTIKKLHGMFSGLYLRKEEPMSIPGGDVIINSYIVSTSELLYDEFEEYLDKIRVWVSENLGYEMPTPDKSLKKRWRDSEERRKKRELKNQMDKKYE